MIKHFFDVALFLIGVFTFKNNYRDDECIRNGQKFGNKDLGFEIEAQVMVFFKHSFFDAPENTNYLLGEGNIFLGIIFFFRRTKPGMDPEYFFTVAFHINACFLSLAQHQTGICSGMRKGDKHIGVFYFGRAFMADKNRLDMREGL